MAARLRKQTGGFVLGAWSINLRNACLSGFAVVLPQGKIRRGNSALTMISVWLASYGRADSPRFDMLAGDAGLGFGRASHATQ
jgi:hypothetical protein